MLKFSPTRRGGETGRRARFRSVWGKTHGGSIPLLGTRFVMNNKNLKHNFIIASAFFSAIIFYFIARAVISLFIPHLNVESLDQLVFRIRLYQIFFAIVASTCSYALLLFIIPKLKYKIIFATVLFLETLALSLLILPSKVQDIAIITIPPDATTIRYHYDAAISDSHDITSVSFELNSSRQESWSFYKDTMTEVFPGELLGPVFLNADHRKREFWLSVEDHSGKSKIFFTRSFESEKY